MQVQLPIPECSFAKWKNQNDVENVEPRLVEEDVDVKCGIVETRFYKEHSNTATIIELISQSTSIKVKIVHIESPVQFYA